MRQVRPARDERAQGGPRPLPSRLATAMAHGATLLLASSWLLILVVLTAGETSLDPSTIPAGTPVRVQVLSDGEDHRLEIEGVIGPIPITGGAVTEFSLPPLLSGLYRVRCDGIGHASSGWLTVH